MQDRPRTPPETLSRARHIAMAEGLRFVYTGNVHDAQGGTTFCPNAKPPCWCLQRMSWVVERHFWMRAG